MPGRYQQLLAKQIEELKSEGHYKTENTRKFWTTFLKI
jgi:hypothetical protein